MSSQVYFVSLGCPKNLVDSQVMLGHLETDMHTICDSPKDADTIIVNTCSFINSARQESVDTILEMADFKSHGKCKTLVVSGCLAQRYSDDLMREIPEVDLVIGTGEYAKISSLLKELKQAILPKRHYVNDPVFIHSDSDPRTITGPKHTVYLKLSEGCNRRCAFCIIPSLRGKVRSRTIDSLVAEATRLVSEGARELSLVAQDLTHYGIDFGGKNHLEHLIEALAKITDLKWIRLHYVYPDQFTDELIDLMARESKVLPYLDMPIQHTQDRILRRMNRGIRRERLFILIAELRKKIPHIAFRTSIIVGFPGETDEDFIALKEDLIELNLDHVGVFRYSDEEGTKAFLLSDKVSPKIAKKRERELIGALSSLRNINRREYLGKKFTVMIDGVDDTGMLLQGRLPSQAYEIDGKVYINEIEKSVLPGELIEVEITDVSPKCAPDFIGRGL